MSRPLNINTQHELKNISNIVDANGDFVDMNFKSVEVDDELSFKYSETEKFTIDKFNAPIGLRGVGFFYKTDVGLPGEQFSDIAHFKEDEVRLYSKLKLGFDGLVDYTFPTIRGNEKQILVLNNANELEWQDNFKNHIVELDPFLNRTNNSIYIDDKFEFDFDVINKQIRWRNVQLFGNNYYSISIRYVNKIVDIQSSDYSLTTVTTNFKYFTQIFNASYNLANYGSGPYQRLTIQPELAGEPVYVIKIFGSNMTPSDGPTKIVVKISRFESTLLT